MIIEIPEIEIEWLSHFFSGRNCLHWEQIVSGEGPVEWLTQVTPWLAFLEVNSPKRPVIFPVFGADGPTEWYAGALDGQMAAKLAEEITSVVGPSYSDFHGHNWKISKDDEIENALHQRFGDAVFRFAPVPLDKRRQIAEVLTIYHKIIARRPAIQNRVERPFGKIRNDFDNSLLAGNEANAKRLLSELCDSGRVNEEQRKCLEIRLLAGLGRQEDLARNHSLISTVIDLSLPPQTITDLVVALYDIYIAPIESDAESEHIFHVFRQKIANPYGRLFRERKGIRHPKVLRAFLWFEVARDDPNHARCEALLSAYPVDAEGRQLTQCWLEKCQPRKNEQQLTGLDRVRQAIADEDYEIAIDIAIEEIPAKWAYSAMLRCADALQSIGVARRVIDQVSKGGEGLQETLNAKDLARISVLNARLKEVELSQVDTNWVVWARWVINGGYSKSPILKLESAVLRWSVDDYLRDGAQCSQLAQLIGNSEGQSEQVFRDAFPHLVEFFVERPPQPMRVFGPLYAMLVKLIAWSGAASADELELTTSLVQALMDVGPSKEMYRECLDDLCEIVASNTSVTHLDWALNAAEMLALYPAQDPELRLRVFMAVVAMARASAHRITATQRAVMEILAKDYACLQFLETFPAFQLSEELEAGESPFSGLIGIYTLTETAGQRAKQLLQKLLPKSKIELNGDSVATDRLKHLASNADVFVFAWRSSKHQAYYCVKEARGSKDLIMPPGKGMASIVRGVLEYLKSF